MAAPVLPLPQVKLPTTPSTRASPEQLYWRSFKSPLLIASPSNSPINHISQPLQPSSASSFSSTTPPDVFTVTTGARVQIYSIRTRKLLKTLTRFDDVARTAEVRPDGRILVAGDETGTIQVLDTNSRAILRTWREHKQPTWVTRFSPADPTTLLSASDDRTVRLWDLPSENSTRTFVGHADYVRSGSFMPGAQSSNLILSGSYDSTVRLWDSRAQGRAVMTFKLSAPVESVLPMPSGTTVLAAADNQVAVLDVVAGKPLNMLKSHQKTVTSLCLASQGERLVTGSLDGHMKVFETTGWNVVAGIKYPSPILSLGVISSGVEREDKHIAVGMQSGLLSLKTRMSGEQKARERARQKEMQALLEGKLEDHDREQKKKKEKKRGKGWEKRLRGTDFTGEGIDIIIESEATKKRKREHGWEIDLRHGRYAIALDNALVTGDKIQILTLITALRHRSAMRAALSGRDEITLQPILNFVYKNITDPRLVGICVEVAMNVLDMYSAHLGQSAQIDQLVEKLHRRVREEVDRAQQAWQMKGMLDMLKVS